jgi:hypothetical protein
MFLKGTQPLCGLLVRYVGNRPEMPAPCFAGNWQTYSFIFNASYGSHDTSVSMEKKEPQIFKSVYLTMRSIANTVRSESRCTLLKTRASTERNSE